MQLARFRLLAVAATMSCNYTAYYSNNINLRPTARTVILLTLICSWQSNFALACFLNVKVVPRGGNGGEEFPFIVSF